jgi:hypothetical protein
MRRVLGGSLAGPWRRGGGRASTPAEHAAAAHSTIPHSTGTRIQDVLESKKMFSHPYLPQAKQASDKKILKEAKLEEQSHKLLSMKQHGTSEGNRVKNMNLVSCYRF